MPSAPRQQVVWATRVTTTYDDVGRVRAITSYNDPDPGEGSVVNQVEYTYNSWGLLSEEEQDHGQASSSVEYTYDDGIDSGVAKYLRLDKVTYSTGRDISFAYNHGTDGAIDEVMSRISAIYLDNDHDGELDPGDAIFASYKYLGAGTIVAEDYELPDVRLNLNNDSNLGGLDRFGRVRDQFWEDYGATTTIDQFLYDYDRAGNLTACENVLHSAFDEDYLYDDLDRLENVDRADDFDQTWTLDAAGNWSELDDDGSTQTRTVDEANQIEAITGGWVTPEYDAAGNMISGPRAGDGATRLHYKYDAWNRLVEVRDDDSGEPDDLIARYEYDATNRRVEKVVAGGAHVHYYYDGWQIVDEETVDGQGATTARNEYVWSLRYIDAPIARLYDADGNGNINGVWYYTTDANHNVTAAFNLYTGAVDERYVYTPYGDVTVYSPTWTTPAAPTTDGPLFAGYFYDAETSLYQVRHRYYHAELGGFVSRDPIGYAGGDGNLYRYVGGRPVDEVDPTGLMPNREMAMDPEEFFNIIEGLEKEHPNMTASQILCLAVDHFKGERRTGSGGSGVTASASPGSPSGSPGHGEVLCFFPYVYTEKAGWIDIAHFMEAARWSRFSFLTQRDVEEFGLGIELLQCVGFLTGKQGTASSAFCPEDLPSNALGACFGENFMPSGPKLSEQLRDYFGELGIRPWHEAPGWKSLPWDEPEWEERFWRTKPVPPLKLPQKTAELAEDCVGDIIYSVDTIMRNPGITKFDLDRSMGLRRDWTLW